jgi:hypothetical protein
VAAVNGIKPTDGQEMKDSFGQSTLKPPCSKIEQQKLDLEKAYLAFMKLCCERVKWIMF